MFFEYVQANIAIAVNVGMEHLGPECHLGRFEGIIGREMDDDEENATSIRTVIWTYDGCLPVEHVLAHRPCTA